ncbi:membrane protein insertion efficiency factor YidD [Elstera cyanobacteriorum]|uniref:membrane protein insertion efficiency factor YidD n=1 Tax=Elstera cyanobacteriorum TaxID=2022747 RepID=UPI002353DB06|nr:membrane protein insertion efficiency factor YidD [Elstera cyanobacteriorum]MCK6443190.1 membrane protein insertion efficiency factor YidD [Elstera cyanobacteriorum]
MTAPAPSITARLLRGAVYLYRGTLSPLLPRACRFEPSCSAYALDALSLHGAGKGSWLTLKRLCRCHPWGGYGYDPVPPVSGFTPGRFSATQVPSSSPSQES